MCNWVFVSQGLHWHPFCCRLKAFARPSTKKVGSSAIIQLHVSGTGLWCLIQIWDWNRLIPDSGTD